MIYDMIPALGCFVRCNTYAISFSSLHHLNEPQKRGKNLVKRKEKYPLRHSSSHSFGNRQLEGDEGV